MVRKNAWADTIREMKQGLGKRNKEGQAVVDFAKRRKLRVSCSNHQNIFCKETGTKSHLQQWRTQFAGRLYHGEKTKNQGGGGYKSCCQ